MLRRFILVAGLTTSVMVPLVWGAYVSLPVLLKTSAHKNRQLQSDVGRNALHKKQELRAAQREISDTYANEFETVGLSAGKQPNSDIKSSSPPATPTSDVQVEKVALRSKGPEIIDLYVGPHIIIVCSELTEAQKLLVGCHY